jgi:hypothetical protein
MLVVGNGPSPCRCHDNVVCEFCVQANLILWERKEMKNGKRKYRAGVLLNTFKKLDKTRLATMLGVKPATIYKWLRLKRIPVKYAMKFYRKFNLQIELDAGGENRIKKAA